MHRARRAALTVALLMAPGAPAAVFQYETLGVSADWIVIRENIPATATDTAACAYPRLDPSEKTGVRVHFVRLPAEAKSGRLTPLIKPPGPVMLYTPSRAGLCTTAAEASRRWDTIAARAKALGISLASDVPEPATLGHAVAAKTCSAVGDGAGCRFVFEHRLAAGMIRIGVALSSVPQAPDRRTCQFMGHRMSVAIEVAGLDFGTLDSGIAPGGFASHYDCRSSQFDPLRLYVFGERGVILASFRGSNMADREEYPFLVVFPARPAP